jgi:hypothetical protein
VDGYDFYEGSREDLASIREFAKQENIAFWFSASITGEENMAKGQKIPSVLTEYLDQLEIIITLQPREHTIHLELVKDHDEIKVENIHLTLDPKILLITKK